MLNNVIGTNSSETINQLDGVTDEHDFINGKGGNDTIFGLGGNDVILGGSGADDIDGGDGTDTSSYIDSNEAVIVSLGTGLGHGGFAEGDTLISVENLTGSKYNDILIGDDEDNTLVGWLGHDILNGGGGDDILFGDSFDDGSGNDTLKGGGGADTLYGGAGSDTASYDGSAAGVLVSLYHDLAGGGDAEGDELNDIENLTGSAHHDDLWGDDGENVLNGMDGADTLKGYGGADTIFGGNHNDMLYGMDGADTLLGGNGHDTLDGGAGHDTMIGGLGNDNYHVNSWSDTVIEVAGQGSDVVYSSAFTYTLADHVETLSLDTEFDTGVYGIGNAQSNTIFGNANDNVLNGGGSSDSLSGLGGNDTFVFQAGQAHGDVVYEFAGNGAGVGDVLRFSGYGTLAEGASFVQMTATEWQITSADGLVQEIITLVGAPVLDASDFLFL